MPRRSIADTITSLKVIRTALCSYKRPHGQMCDCKFGVHHLPNQRTPQLPSGENGCGCPEIYDAIAYLEQLQGLYNKIK